MEMLSIVLYTSLTPLGLRTQYCHAVHPSSWSGDVGHNGVRAGGPVSHK